MSSQQCFSHKATWRSAWNFPNLVRSVINLSTNLLSLDLYNTMIYIGDLFGIVIAYEYATS